MGRPLSVGTKVMLPPLMPCGSCYYCVHYPQTANKCLTPVYYGRYLGFERPPHLWGGWAEQVYVDLEELPGTKVYALPDDMPLRLATLAEPLTSCVRALRRASRAGGFEPGATVVVQGSGPIGVLATAAAQELGAGTGHRRRGAGAPSPGTLPGIRGRSDRLPGRSPDPRGADRGGAAHRRRLRSRPGAGLQRPPLGRPGGDRDAARRRNLRGDGPVHGRRLHRHQLAPHLHQGPERAGELGVHGRRHRHRHRPAVPCARPLPVAVDADAVPVHGAGHRVPARRRPRVRAAWRGRPVATAAPGRSPGPPGSARPAGGRPRPATARPPPRGSRPHPCRC